MTTDPITEIEVSLKQASERLTAPLPGECLLHYLQRMLAQFGWRRAPLHRALGPWAQGARASRAGVGRGHRRLLLRLRGDPEQPRPALQSPARTALPQSHRRAGGTGRAALVTEVHRHPQLPHRRWAHRTVGVHMEKARMYAARRGGLRH